MRLFRDVAIVGWENTVQPWTERRCAHTATTWTLWNWSKIQIISGLANCSIYKAKHNCRMHRVSRHWRGSVLLPTAVRKIWGMTGLTPPFMPWREGAQSDRCGSHGHDNRKNLILCTKSGVPVDNHLKNKRDFRRKQEVTNTTETARKIQVVYMLSQIGIQKCCTG